MSSSRSPKGKERDLEDSFTCQRCHQPILLDPSITSLDAATYDDIASTLPGPSTSRLSVSDKLASLPASSQASAQAWAAANGIPYNPQTHSRHPNIAESFVLLSDSVISPPSASTSSSSSPHANGHHIPGPQLASNLHSILSSTTPISHPLCTECTALLQSELQKQLEDLTQERDAYLEFEKGIIKNRDTLKTGNRRKTDGITSTEQGREGGLGEYDLEGTEEDWQALHRRKRELENEEEILKKQLEDKERQLANARKEEQKVKEEEEEVAREEEEFLLHHAALSTERKHLLNTLHSAKTHLLLSQRLLSHLESTNVYNDAFQIGHAPLDSAGGGRNGLTVGTINGLRLGGRPVVDWDEINAAWGLVALCIDRIAVKVGCKFELYRIMSLASYSRIEELPPNKGIYELYASSDLSPARLLQNRRFNYGLVAILELLRQLVEYGRKHDRGWGVGNIEIRKDRISGHSIRLPGISAMQMPALPSMSIMGLGGSNSASAASNRDETSGNKDDGSGDEQWTRACRAVLAVLKRILIVESEADRRQVAQSAPNKGT